MVRSRRAGVDPLVRAAVEVARERPSPFASFRNLVAERSEALARDLYPTCLQDPRRGATPGRRRGGREAASGGCRRRRRCQRVTGRRAPNSTGPRAASA
eukprot:2056781-Pleurochrysis_carterae.AAC.1